MKQVKLDVSDKWAVPHKGLTEIHEIKTICELIHLFAPKDLPIMEIGTNLGVTTLALAANFPRRLVYTVDVYQDKVIWPWSCGAVDVQKIDQMGVEYRGKVVNVAQLHVDSAKLDPQVLPQMGAIFIDGCHTRDMVAADTVKSIKMIANRGILIWHDFMKQDILPGVMKGVQDCGIMDEVTWVEGTSIAYLVWG